MKIRIKGNAVRFRLTAAELEHLLSAGAISDAVVQDVGGALVPVMRYGLTVVDSATEIRAAEGNLSIGLNAGEARSMARGEQEGVYLRSETAGQDGILIRSMVYVEIEKKRRTPKRGRPDPADWVVTSPE